MNYGKVKTLLARFKTEGWMDVVLYTIKRVHYRNNRNYNCIIRIKLLKQQIRKLSASTKTNRYCGL